MRGNFCICPHIMLETTAQIALHNFFINQKSLINFLRLKSSGGYQLLVGTGMETVNSSLNTAPRLMIRCLCVAGQRGNTAQLQYARMRAHARARARTHTHTHTHTVTL